MNILLFIQYSKFFYISILVSCINAFFLLVHNYFCRFVVWPNLSMFLRSTLYQRVFGCYAIIHLKRQTQLYWYVWCRFILVNIECYHVQMSLIFSDSIVCSSRSDGAVYSAL